MSGARVRELRKPAELRLAQDVARAAWGFDELSLPLLTGLVAVLPETQGLLGLTRRGRAARTARLRSSRSCSEVHS